MSERGFTLVETLLALALAGVVLVAMLPTFTTYMDANSLNEVRTGGVAAAQQVMEALRREDPVTLPSTGSSAVQYINTGDHEYEVVTRYCVNGSLCTASSRHLLVEVSYGGEIIYDIETVFTRLH